MQFIDTFPSIFSAFPNRTFEMEAWRRYAGTISPSLAALCENDITDYDFSSDVEPVLTACLQQEARAKSAHDVFLQVTKGLPTTFQRIFGVDLDVTVILYLGLCNGAGWATTLDGHPVVLLGIEKILELDWGDTRNLIGLIYHELGHIWHFETRGGIPELTSPKQRALWQLYAEGMAMHTEQLLCGNMDFYHQDTDGWLDWCRAHRSILFQAYRRRVDAEDAVREFFGDWCKFMGHSDCGYFLGGELIRALSHQFSPRELARLDLEAVYAALVDLCSD